MQIANYYDRLCKNRQTNGKFTASIHSQVRSCNQLAFLALKKWRLVGAKVNVEAKTLGVDLWSNFCYIGLSINIIYTTFTNQDKC